MKSEYDLLVIIVALATLLGTLWQGKSQAKQIKLLISERDFQHEQSEEKNRLRQDEKLNKIDILFERVTTLTRQLEKLETKLEQSVREIFKRINEKKDNADK